jgi:hypothetical protein
MKTLSAIERPAILREKSADLLDIADEIDVIRAAAKTLQLALDAQEDTQHLVLTLQRSVHLAAR